MKNMKKSVVLLFSVALILAVAAGSTLAFLITKSNEVKNTFKYANTRTEITEELTGQTKSNVKVKNNGTPGEDASIVCRVTYVAYWTDKAGNVVTNLPTGYTSTETVQQNKNGWEQIGNYWYYLTPITPGNSTPALPLVWTANTPNPSDYVWHVDILSDSIQADPVKAHQEAWDITK